MADVKNPDASTTVTEETSGTGGMKEKASAAAAGAREKFSGAAAGAKRSFSQAGDSMKSAASQARQKYDQVREKVSSADYGAMTSDLRGYVRENPGKAIIVAAGVGFLIGLLLRDSEE